MFSKFNIHVPFVYILIRFFHIWIFAQKCPRLCFANWIFFPFLWLDVFVQVHPFKYTCHVNRLCIYLKKKDWWLYSCKVWHFHTLFSLYLTFKKHFLFINTYVQWFPRPLQKKWLRKFWLETTLGYFHLETLSISRQPY